MSKALLISALAAAAQARFGQEQIPVAAVQALSDFGAPGAAGTLSGQIPGTLLAAANACAKLLLADQIVEQLGDDEQVILAAIGLVNAEQNFNPFAVATGKICADATLPVTVALRGILPSFDPDVLGSDVQNANALLSVQTPFDSDGLSVAEISILQGFSNFTAEDADGNVVDLAGAGAGAAAVAAADDDVAAAVEVSAACGGVVAAVEADAEEDDAEAADAEDDAEAADAEDDADAGGAVAVAGAGAGAGGTSLAGVDFGTCDPTIRREGGLGGRPANELTFQSNDPNIESIQQEALNPNIITNRVCDELVNQCGANQAALDACDAAQAAVAAIGAPDDRSDATVEIFNSALGF